ncbi:M23 family peptidase [Aggregatimonas sangjinii]|uniref:M23 family peptidase n=1 Tax=Aggregatimonas sangjinii TaxID=2583587 RepID=A0A5B7SYH3_9FLAO|nr:peptidoglycan DD-metalloendopeptidase family protein [Aggregatimonas sangjinii]QCX02128.1 M23 family peptidase [Aggregatimonas sangjinii]
MRKYLGVLIALFAIISCKDESSATENAPNNELKKEAVATQPLEEKIVVKEFGFELDNFKVKLDTVRKGDSFGELMISHKVDYPKIAKISQDFKDTFDVRKIRVGNPYMILQSKDTTETAQVFIYENDRINYTVVDLRDSVSAYKDKRAVKYVEREASGVIETSLSDAILAQGIDYAVTHDLANIYAWTIDFNRLQKGDKFKLIYKEKYINDSIYAGSEAIEAAYFEHNGKPIYSFAYENDSLKSLVDYFDQDANSLRRTFLRMPVEYGRLSSRYNLKRRIRYYGNRIRPHRGTDYAAAVGTPILATADGTVTESTRRGGNGKYVKIRHNSTYSTQYLHMKKQNVKRGEFVRQGDIIGWIGMTGNTSGPHVCYRFWRNGKEVDPLREELPQAEPLAEELRPEYFEYIAPKKKQLDCILYPEMPAAEENEDLLTLNQ